MKQIKEAGIPFPPSGFWTKLNFNKPVTKLELPEPADEKVVISRTIPSTRKKKQQIISDKNSGRTAKEAIVAESSPILKSYVLQVEGVTIFPSTTKK